jgi:hypothetical protein
MCIPYMGNPGLGRQIEAQSRFDDGTDHCRMPDSSLSPALLLGELKRAAGILLA